MSKWTHLGKILAGLKGESARGYSLVWNGERYLWAILGDKIYRLRGEKWEEVVGAK